MTMGRPKKLEGTTRATGITLDTPSWGIINEMLASGQVKGISEAVRACIIASDKSTASKAIARMSKTLCEVNAQAEQLKNQLKEREDLIKALQKNQSQETRTVNAIAAGTRAYTFDELLAMGRKMRNDAPDRPR